MADEYIRKYDAIRLAEQGQVQGFQWQFQMLIRLPPADVAPVVHGRWIDTDSHLGYFANCSVCGYQMDVHAERGYFNFCPNCWAKMDAQIEE